MICALSFTWAIICAARRVSNDSNRATSTANSGYYFTILSLLSVMENTVLVNTLFRSQLNFQFNEGLESPATDHLDIGQLEQTLSSILSPPVSKADNTSLADDTQLVKHIFPHSTSVAKQNPPPPIQLNLIGQSFDQSLNRVQASLTPDTSAQESVTSLDGLNSIETMSHVGSEKNESEGSEHSADESSESNCFASIRIEKQLSDPEVISTPTERSEEVYPEYPPGFDPHEEPQKSRSQLWFSMSRESSEQSEKRRSSLDQEFTNDKFDTISPELLWTQFQPLEEESVDETRSETCTVSVLEICKDKLSSKLSADAEEFIPHEKIEAKDESQENLTAESSVLPRASLDPNTSEETPTFADESKTVPQNPDPKTDPEFRKPETVTRRAETVKAPPPIFPMTSMAPNPIIPFFCVPVQVPFLPQSYATLPLNLTDPMQTSLASDFSLPPSPPNINSYINRNGKVMRNTTGAIRRSQMLRSQPTIPYPPLVSTAILQPPRRTQAIPPVYSGNLVLKTPGTAPIPWSPMAAVPFQNVAQFNMHPTAPLPFTLSSTIAPSRADAGGVGISGKTSPKVRLPENQTVNPVIQNTIPTSFSRQTYCYTEGLSKK